MISNEGNLAKNEAFWSRFAWFMPLLLEGFWCLSSLKFAWKIHGFSWITWCLCVFWVGGDMKHVLPNLWGSSLVYGKIMINSELRAAYRRDFGGNTLSTTMKSEHLSWFTMKMSRLFVFVSSRFWNLAVVGGCCVTLVGSSMDSTLVVPECCSHILSSKFGCWILKMHPNQV